MRLLQVDSSVLGPNSASRALTADVVAAERARVPGLTVVYRDLAAQPLGHLSSAYVAATRAGVVDPSPEAQREFAEGQAALAEFLAADVVVIGAPMYNFGLPSQLKAWLDRIVEKGKTFNYGERGPEGLAGGKRVIVVSSRGGMYGAGTPMAALDHQETYLRGLFGFLGVTDLTVVRAEGLNMTGHREPAMTAAREAIAQLA